MEPILIEVPEEIVSERLLLRAPRAGEAEEINRAVQESLAELQPWMPWATPAPPLENTEEYSRRVRGKWITREQLDYRLFLKDGGAYLGSCGFPRLNWKVPSGEIGYWLRSSHSGRGLMTEAVIALTKMALETLKFHRVEIRMDNRNVRSWRLAERAGFTLEGILRCERRGVHGELEDTRVYSITRSE